MTQAVRQRVGIGVALVTVALVAIELTLLPAQKLASSSGRIEILGNVLIIVACAIVGLMIIARVPGNVIGWVFALVALVWEAADVAGAYAVRDSATSVSLPGAVWLAVFATPLWFAAVPPGATLLLLLFPTGRLPSHRWRIVVWGLALGTLVAVLGVAATPGPLADHPGSQNPFVIPGLGAALALIVQGGYLLVGASFVAAIAAMSLRWRRAVGAERQQMKWMAYAGVLALTYYLVRLLVPPLLGQIGAVIMAVLFPVAAGIAIVRHRLYDIDRLISRTLVYGSLTALLTLVYVGAVFTLGTLPGVGDSQVAVAASTLLVAALFQPLRRRLQQRVNRRFNRRGYDAVVTVQAFSSRLRDEIDLDELSTSLLTAVHAAVEPARVSLWLQRP